MSGTIASEVQRKRRRAQWRIAICHAVIVSILIGIVFCLDLFWAEVLDLPYWAGAYFLVLLISLTVAQVRIARKSTNRNSEPSSLCGEEPGPPR